MIRKELIVRKCLTVGVSLLLFIGCQDGPPEGLMRSLRLTPDGKSLAKTSASGVAIYELSTGKRLGDFRIEPNAEKHIRTEFKISADSRYLATSNTEHLTLWDLVSGKQLGRWKGTNRHGFKMDFGGDAPFLAAADDNTLRVWEAKSQNLLLTIPLPYEMNALAISSNGKLLAVGGGEIKMEGKRGHEIRIWELPTGKLRGLFKGEQYCYVKSLQFSPQCDQLATALSVRACQVWDLTSNKVLWVQKVKSVDYEILTFSPDGKRIAVGGLQSMTLLDAKDGREVRSFELPDNPGGFATQITGVAYLADPERLLIAQRSGVVESIEAASGKTQRLWPPQK